MNIAYLIQLIIGLVKPFIPLGATQAHGAVERLVTIPNASRQKLYAGMTDDEKAHAEGLHAKMVDSVSDYTVYVASRGSIEED